MHAHIWPHIFFDWSFHSPSKRLKIPEHVDDNRRNSQQQTGAQSIQVLKYEAEQLAEQVRCECVHRCWCGFLCIDWTIGRTSFSRSNRTITNETASTERAKREHRWKSTSRRKTSIRRYIYSEELSFVLIQFVLFLLEHVHGLEQLLERYTQEEENFRQRNDSKKADLSLQKKNLVAKEVNLSRRNSSPPYLAMFLFQIDTLTSPMSF